jgi:hypothetical protein
MNNIPPAPGAPGLLQTIRYPDFDVCWAGPNPFRDGFCFGSEHGQLLYTDELGRPYGNPGKGSASGEAINGVAGSNDWLAVSTREEVNFLKFPKTTDSPFEMMQLAVGAHGVVTAPSGYFVAPLGHSGILVVKPGTRIEDPKTISTSDKQRLLYYYRVLTLPGDRGEDQIVCACRRGGVGITGFHPDLNENKLSTLTFEDLDVVDVCGIGSASYPRAVAAVGRDGTLIFIRDVVRDKTPQTLKFDTVQGTAYRLLSAHGDLFLLTSKGIYVLAKLAARFLEGPTLGTFITPVRTFHLQAVDANLVRDRWLLVVTPDEILKYNVEMIHQSAPEHLGLGEVQELQPRVLIPQWEEHGVAQKTTQILAAV